MPSTDEEILAEARKQLHGGDPRTAEPTVAGQGHPSRQSIFGVRTSVSDDDEIFAEARRQQKASAIGFREAARREWERTPGEELVPFGDVGRLVTGKSPTWKLYRAAEVVRQGDETDPEYERSLLYLKEYQDEQARIRDESRRKTFMGKVGSGIVGIAPRLPKYLVEFGVTGPLYTLGRKVGSKLLGKGAKSAVSKFAGRQLARATGAAAQTPAVMAGSIGERTIQRLTPYLNITEDETGRLEAAFQDTDDNFLSALTKSFGEGFIETATERSGLHLMKPLNKAATKLGLKRAITARWLEKNPNATVDDLITKLRSKTAWHGPIAEILEEEAGKAARAGVGLEEYKLTTLDELVAMGASFALPEAGFRGLRGLSRLATMRRDYATDERAEQEGREPEYRRTEAEREEERQDRERAIAEQRARETGSRGGRATPGGPVEVREEVTEPKIPIIGGVNSADLRNIASALEPAIDRGLAAAKERGDVFGEARLSTRQGLVRQYLDDPSPANAKRLGRVLGLEINEDAEGVPTIYEALRDRGATMVTEVERPKGEAKAIVEFEDGLWWRTEPTGFRYGPFGSRADAMGRVAKPPSKPAPAAAERVEEVTEDETQPKPPELMPLAGLGAEELAEALNLYADKSAGFDKRSGKTVGFTRTTRITAGLPLWENMTPDERMAEFRSRAQEDFKKASEEAVNPVEYMIERALDPLDPMSGIYKILLLNRGAAIEGGKIRLSPELESLRAGRSLPGAKPPRPIISGSRWSAVTPVKSAGVDGVWGVVDAADLVSSNDSGYDQRFQPRDRRRMASREQIAEIASRLQPERLGASETTDLGSPIVDEHNQVLSGNGRLEAIRLIYDSQSERGAEYKQFVMREAQRLGVDPAKLEGIKQPVLVRRVTNFGEITKGEFARQSNEQQVLGMSDAEKANRDAAMLVDNPGLLDIFLPNESGDVLAASNREFLNKFIQGTGDRATLLNADGSYNVKALGPRVKAAVLGALLGAEDRNTISNLVERAVDLNIANVASALQNAAPRLLKFRGNPYDLSPILNQAIKDLVTIRTEGRKAEEFLGQSTLFGDAQRTAESDYLLLQFAKLGSSKQIAEGLTRYAELASKIDVTTPDIFGAKLATREELLQQAYERKQAPEASQTGLPLAKPPGQAPPTGPQAQPAAKGVPTPPGPAAEAPAVTPFGSENVLISAQRAEELKKRIKDKLKNVNIGIDPTIFSDAVQLGAYYIEGGLHRFSDWAAKMLEDLGDVIKDHLRSIYETARVTIESPSGESRSGQPPGLQPGLLPPGERIVTARPEHTNAADESVIPKELLPHLDPHQRQGSATAIRSMEVRGGMLLADAAGVGKTRQGITVGKYEADRGSKVVIVTPSMVIKQNWKKGTFGGSYAYDSGQMGVKIRLARDGNVNPGEIGITTHENWKDIAANTDGNTVLIIDECFVPGTKIKMADGTLKEIEKIKPGEFVKNASGCGEVEAVSRRWAGSLVKIATEAGSVICTPNHPFLTQHGWIKAGQLSQSHYLKTHDETMRMVWGSVCGENRPAETEILRDFLFGEMEDQPTRIEGDVFDAAIPETSFRRFETGAQLESKTCGGGFTAYDDEQSNADRWSSGKGVSHASTNRPRPVGQGWERNWPNSGGADFVECSTWDEAQPRRFAWKENKGLSDMLQGRCSHARNQDGNRVRRVIPWRFCATTSGPKEGGETVGIRVDSVESVQQKDFTRYGGGNSGVEVYNLQVSGHPSYVLSNGAVVHNCHFLKNQSQRSQHATRAIAKAKSVLFMSATPGDKPEHIYYLARMGIMEGKTVQQQLSDLGMTLVTIDKMVKEADGTWRKRRITFWAPDQRVTDTQRHERFSALFDRMTASGAMLKREISMKGTHVQVLKITLPPEAHDAQQLIIDTALRAYHESHFDDVKGLRKANILMHLRRQQEPFKIASAVMLAQRELAAGRQVLIFVSRVNESEAGFNEYVKTLSGEVETVRHVAMTSEGTAKLLREALEDAGIHDIAEIHGGAEQGALEALSDYQGGRKRVMIATIESAGTGINADDIVGNLPRSMIVVTAPFDAVSNVQAAGRIWRLKTLSGSNYFFLFGDTSVDDWNADIIGSKMKQLGAIVEGQIRKLDISDPDLDSTDDYHETMRGQPAGPSTAVVLEKFPQLEWKPFQTKGGRQMFVASATPAFWKWWNANGKRDNALGVSVTKYKEQWQVWSDKPLIVRGQLREEQPLFGAPETVEQQKARELAEQKRRAEAEAKRKLEERASKKLTGTAGDLGQKDLFGGETDLWAMKEASGDQPTLDGIAQDIYGKDYDDLTQDEKGVTDVTYEAELRVSSKKETRREGIYPEAGEPIVETRPIRQARAQTTADLSRTHEELLADAEQLSADVTRLKHELFNAKGQPYESRLQAQLESAQANLLEITGELNSRMDRLRGIPRWVELQTKSKRGSITSAEELELTGIRAQADREARSERASATQAQLGEPRAMFYSRLTRTVEQSQQGRATGAQWKATIKGSKLGVSQGEMDLVGIEDLEDGKTYTKQEVLDYLKANEVVVKDVTLGKEPVASLPLRRFMYREGIESPTTTDEWLNLSGRIEDKAKALSMRGDDRQAAEFFEMAEAANRAAEGLDPETGSTQGQTRFSTYQLPGAKKGSYREALLTVPEDAGLSKMTDAQMRDFYQQAFGVMPTEAMDTETLRKDIEKKLRYHGTDFVERMGGVKSPMTVWRDGHSQFSDIANPIVRLRFNERTTSDGKRMLFLEEIQPPLKGEFEKMPALFQKNWREIAFKYALKLAASSSESLDLQRLRNPKSIWELGENVFGREMASAMPLEVVDGGVLSAFHHDQVLQAVVSNLPVDVVNNLTRLKISPDSLLRNPSMVFETLPVSARNSIARGVLGAMREVGALLGAKLASGLNRGVDVEILPALMASHLEVREVVGALAPQSLYHDFNARGGLENRPASLGTKQPAPVFYVTGRGIERLPTNGAEFLSTVLPASGRAESGVGATRPNAEGGGARLADVLDWHNKILRETGNSKQGDFTPEISALGWTTGEQQAERYDLSKQVDAIKVNVRTDGNFNIEVKPPGNLGFRAIASGIKPGELENYIGKDLSRKVLEGLDSASEFVYEGVSLKVGGEGLTKLYDVDFRNVVNNLPAVKKSGQKVGTAEIPKPSGRQISEENQLGRMKEGSWVVQEEGGQFLYGTPSEAQATAWAERQGLKNYKVLENDKYGETDLIHSLTLTPQIRESVMGGQALFQLPAGSKGLASTQQLITQQIKAKRGIIEQAPEIAVGLEDILAMVERSDLHSAVKGVLVNFLRKPFAKKLDLSRLTLELRDYLDHGYSGEIIGSLIRIGRDMVTPTTLPHEIDHFLFNFLPQESRDIIEAERRRRLEARARELGIDLKDLPVDLVAGMMESEHFAEALAAGALPRSLYPYINAAEFSAWITSAEAELEYAQRGALRDIINTIMDWLRGLMDGLRRMAGFTPSFEQVMREKLAGRYMNSAESGSAFDKTRRASFAEDPKHAQRLVARAKTRGEEAEKVERQLIATQVAAPIKFIEKHGPKDNPVVSRMLGLFDMQNIMAASETSDAPEYRELREQLKNTAYFHVAAWEVGARFHVQKQRWQEILDDRDVLEKEIGSPGFKAKLKRLSETQLAEEAITDGIKQFMASSSAAVQKAVTRMKTEALSEAELERLMAEVRDGESRKEYEAAIRQAIKDIIRILPSEKLSQLYDIGEHHELESEYNRLKSELYGVEKTTQPMDPNIVRWAFEAMRVAPRETRKIAVSRLIQTSREFSKELSDYEKQVVTEMEASPRKAVTKMLEKQRTLTRKQQMLQLAFEELHKDLQKKIRDYGNHVSAGAVVEAIFVDADVRAYENTVNVDGGIEARPMARVQVNGEWINVKDLHYDVVSGNPIFVRPNGQLLQVNITGDVKQFAAEREKLRALLQEWYDWKDVQDKLAPEVRDPHYQFFLNTISAINHIYLSTRVSQPASAVAPANILSNQPLSDWDMPRFLIDDLANRIGGAVKVLGQNFNRVFLHLRAILADNVYKQKNLARRAVNSLGLKKGRSWGEAYMVMYDKVLKPLAAMAQRPEARFEVGYEIVDGYKVTPELLQYLEWQSKIAAQAFNAVQELVPGERPGLAFTPVIEDAVLGYSFFGKSIPVSRYTLPFGGYSNDALAFGRAYAQAKLEGDRGKQMQLLKNNWELLASYIVDRASMARVVSEFEPAYELLAEKIRAGTIEEKSFDWVASRIAEIMPAETEAEISEEEHLENIGEKLVSELDNLVNFFNKIEGEKSATVHIKTPDKKNSFTARRHDQTLPYYFLDYGWRTSGNFLNFMYNGHTHAYERFAHGLEAVLKDLQRQQSELTTKYKERAERLGITEERSRKELVNENKLAFLNGQTFDQYWGLEKRIRQLKKAIQNTMEVWAGGNDAEMDIRAYMRFQRSVIGGILSGPATLIRNGGGLAYLGNVLARTMRSGVEAGGVAAWNIIWNGMFKYVPSAALGVAKIGVKLPGSAYTFLKTLATTRDVQMSVVKAVSPLIQELSKNVYSRIEDYRTMEENRLMMPIDSVNEFEAKIFDLANAGLIIERRRGLMETTALSLLGFFDDFVLTALTKPVLPRLGDASINSAALASGSTVLNRIEKRLRVLFEQWKKSGAIETRFNFTDRNDPRNVFAGQEIFPGKVETLSRQKMALLEQYFDWTGKTFHEAAYDFIKALHEGREAEFMDKHARLQFAEQIEQEINVAGPLNRPQWTQKAGFFNQIMAPLMGWNVHALRTFPKVLSRPGVNPHTSRLVMWITIATMVLPVVIALNLAQDTGLEELIRLFSKHGLGIERPTRQPWEREGTRSQAIATLIAAVNPVPYLATVVNTALNDMPNRASYDINPVMISKLNDVVTYMGGVVNTGDPLYGLNYLVKGFLPVSEAFLNRIPWLRGTAEALSARRLMTRFGPQDLLREKVGGGGMSRLATPLTPYADRMLNAAMQEDWPEFNAQYAEAVEVARELGRDEPEETVQDAFLGRNPYSRAFRQKLSQSQRSAFMGKLGADQRALVEGVERKFRRGADLLGRKTSFAKEDEFATVPALAMIAPRYTTRGLSRRRSVFARGPIGRLGKPSARYRRRGLSRMGRRPKLSF